MRPPLESATQSWSGLAIAPPLAPVVLRPSEANSVVKDYRSRREGAEDTVEFPGANRIVDANHGGVVGLGEAGGVADADSATAGGLDRKRLDLTEPGARGAIGLQGHLEYITRPPVASGATRRPA